MADEQTEFSARLVAADGAFHELAGECRVGRSTDCAISIDDTRVSRAHAVLRVEGERVTVEDLGSANGTRVNALPVKEAVTLADGDTVCFDKYCFTVAISGAAADLDATVVDSDATVVRSLAAEASPRAGAASAAAPDLPGSWVDSGTSEHTRVLSMERAVRDSPGAEGASDLPPLSSPRLIVQREDGARGEVFELELAGSAEPDVWEIGRETSCEIVLGEPSVSARHAQLIHQGGRWRLVNLVSANGIFVNGEKKLTAYLCDGDRIQLGLVTLVFRAGPGQPAVAPQAAVTASTAASGQKSGGLRIVAVVGAVLAALLLWWLLA